MTQTLKQNVTAGYGDVRGDLSKNNYNAIVSPPAVSYTHLTLPTIYSV